MVGSRIVLETSWPPTVADPGAEIAAIRALGLPPADETAVLGGNLVTLLDL